MRIKAEDTFAIVIDYQEKILPAMSGQEELLRKSQILLGGLKALEVSPEDDSRRTTNAKAAT